MSVRRLICTWLSLCPLIAGTAMAQPVEVPGFTHVRSLGGIDEYRLDANGLTVLAVPDSAATVVSFQVLYRVGSRNEAAGTTGDTHLLEHLMFKGSQHYNKALGNALNSYMERVGATFNATTSMDRTNYFGTLGRDALEGYIAIEADRMRNLLLRPEDLASEMTVVRNEYERGENSPFTALFQQVMATAYQAHPYHHPTIGWRSDIEHASVDKLRRFYDTFYWPDNATVILVGDFRPDQALGWVRQYYGGIPRAPQAIPAVTTEEPPQQGPRRLVLKRAGATGSLIIAFKGPRARPRCACVDRTGPGIEPGQEQPAVPRTGRHDGCHASRRRLPCTARSRPVRRDDQPAARRETRAGRENRLDRTGEDQDRGRHSRGYPAGARPLPGRSGLPA